MDMNENTRRKREKKNYDTSGNAVADDFINLVSHRLADNKKSNASCGEIFDIFQRTAFATMRWSRRRLLSERHGDN